MAQKHSDHLWKRGGQWYFRMVVPRPLHSRVLSDSGKHIHMITKALGDSESQARRKRDRLVVICGELFDRARAGETITADQIKIAMDLDFQDITEQYKSKIIQSLPHWFHRLAEKHHPDQSIFDIDPNFKAALGSGYQEATDAVLAKLRELGEPESLSLGVETPTETISQAAEAWFDEMQRDPSAAVKQTTLDGHRNYVGAFIKACGDIPLASVTRAMASDFLTKISAGRSNRTVNNYATTLASIFKSAKYRGRFTGDNPFEDQKRKAGGESYSAFTVSELQTLFDSLPREITPPKHTAETALPWTTLIGAYTGMRLEEICQLKAADIRDVAANGATVTVFDIHNGGVNNLKNESSVRLVPMHSELFRAGLLRYRDALPKDSPLFPGLTRRASKGGKVGARLGELFRNKLVALGLKRKGLCFHSFRHTVSGRLESAGVSETDAARVLGHTIPGMSYGVYSTGPGLKRLAGVIEAIEYHWPESTASSLNN